MFYLTDERDQPLGLLRPLSVDTIDSAESVSQSSTLTYNGKAAAGAISMCALPYRNVLNPTGTKHGSHWEDPENLVYSSNFGDGLSAVVETATAATCTIVDPNNNLELMFESATTTVKRYVLKVTDTTGASLYGWIFGVAATGNSYVFDITNNRVSETQSWVGTLASFTHTSLSKVEIFKYESSLSFGTGTTFTEEVQPPVKEGVTWKEALEAATSLSNGQFFTDYKNGLLIGKRADTTASETVTYMIEVASVGGTTSAVASNVNVSKMNSVTVSMGAGAVGTGVQRTTLASDDPAVASLGKIDDWDAVHDSPVGADGAQIMMEAKDYDGDALPNAVQEGDAGRAAMTIAGVQYVMPVIENGSKTPIAGFSSVLSNANGGTAVIMAGTEAKTFDGAALPNAVSEGDAGNITTTEYGVQYVMPVSADGSKTLLLAEDAVHASGDLGTQVLSVYKATAAQLAGTDGDYAPLLTNATGHLHTADGFAPQAEDNTNGVIATQNKPLAVSTYAWAVDKSAALEASSIAKASAGVVRLISGRIDSTLASGTYYIQVLNSATLPADGAVTYLVAPTKLVHTTGTDTVFNLDFTMNGVYASAGIVVCISSAEFTKVIGGAYLSMTILYI